MDKQTGQKVPVSWSHFFHRGQMHVQRPTIPLHGQEGGISPR